MTLTSVNLEPPEETATSANCKQDVPEWYFRNQRLDTMPGYLTSLGFDDASRQWLLSHTDCYDEGCVAVPNFELINQLSPDLRRRLYGELRREASNSYLMRGFRCPASEFESRIAKAGLDPSTEARLRHLAYLEDGLIRMHDIALLCARAHSDEERERIVRTLARAPAVMAHLEIGPHDDIDAIAKYWRAHGRNRDAQPTLEAARRRATEASPATIDVIHLLPPMPRARLDTFVHAHEARHECTWAARNFFLDPPDAVSADDMRDAVSALAGRSSRVMVPAGALPLRDPVEIEELGAGLELGDTLVFLDSEGVPIHMASFVAGDLAFTKNGVGEWNPFVLMRVRDLTSVYPGTVEIHAYRMNFDTVDNGRGSR